MISKDKNIYFQITGKALFVATEFESNLKAVCNGLGIREISIETPEKIEKFIDKISKFQSPKALIKEYDLDKIENLREILNEAITSRNYIAHDLALGLELRDSDEFSIQEFIESEIQPNISNILKATFIMKGLIAQSNKEENNFSNTWITSREKWVIEN